MIRPKKTLNIMHRMAAKHLPIMGESDFLEALKEVPDVLMLSIENPNLIQNILESKNETYNSISILAGEEKEDSYDRMVNTSGGVYLFWKNFKGLMVLFKDDGFGFPPLSVKCIVRTGKSEWKEYDLMEKCKLPA